MWHLAKATIKPNQITNQTKVQKIQLMKSSKLILVEINQNPSNEQNLIRLKAPIASLASTSTVQT